MKPDYIDLEKKPQANQQVKDEEINFNNKDHLVQELSCRWWYAIPEWPPADHDIQ